MHYVLIKDFKRFMTTKQSFMVISIFVDIAYNAQQLKNVRKACKICLAINYTKVVMLSEENSYIRLQNFKI